MPSGWPCFATNRGSSATTPRTNERAGYRHARATFRVVDATVLPRSHPNGRETDVVVEWNVLAIRASSARTPVLDRLCFPAAPKMNSGKLARLNNAIEGRRGGIDREFRPCPPRPVSRLHCHRSKPFEPNPTPPHTRRHQRAHAGARRHTRIKPHPGPLPVPGNDRRRRQHPHPGFGSPASTSPRCPLPDDPIRVSR